MTPSWLDKPRDQWWTKEAVLSVANANRSKEMEIDGVTLMMIAAYKQWQDIEELLRRLSLEDGGDPTLDAIHKRHTLYGDKIRQAAEWRAGMLEAKAGT
jgi:hypothetical protein